MDLTVFKEINILMICDDEKNKKLIISFLSRYPLITIFEATKGDALLEILKKDAIDLVLLDLSMPMINDNNALVEIKEAIIKQSIPTMIMSTHQNNFRMLDVEDKFAFNPVMVDELEDEIYNYMKVRQEKYLFLENLNKKLAVVASFTVLVTDDDPFLREVIISFLSKNKNITFIEASNGQEALDILEKESIDLILLDLHMPVLNGAQTLRKIKNSKKYDLIPVVVITSDEQESKNFKILEGINNFLLKPINGIDLEQKVYHNITIRMKNLSAIKQIETKEEMSPKEESQTVKIDMNLVERTPLQYIEFKFLNFLKRREEKLKEKLILKQKLRYKNFFNA